MGNFLKRDLLLAKVQLEIEKVVFENGDFVYVRQMTGHERDIFEKSIMKPIRNKKGQTESYETILEDFRAKLAVMTICEEDGSLVLGPEDASTLSKNISAKMLEAIVNVAQRINAISEQDKEDLVKNSAAGQAGNSSSASVEN